MELQKIRRPSASLVKLVESFGILLHIQKSDRKSVYKVPLPSNYNAVVDELSSNYSELLLKVAQTQSSELTNEVATDFFRKSLEPGFSYEDAVNTGGLTARDLFNAIALVLTRLQLDPIRIPIHTTNVLVLASGSRSSYAALDAAMHVFKHGCITVASAVVEDALRQRESAMLQAHLHKDLLRRVKLLYKVPDHCFSLQALHLRSMEDMPHALVGAVQSADARTLVMGLEEDTLFGEGGDCGLPIWAATYFAAGGERSGESSDLIPASTAATETDARDKLAPVALLLVKGRSRVRPFTVVNSSRTFVVYVDSAARVNQTFLSTLTSVRPGDSVHLVYIAASREPVGHSRADRFSMGVRSGWVGLEPSFAAGSATGRPYDHSYQPDKPGWNDEATEQLQTHMQSLLASAKLDGEARIERLEPGRTPCQILCALLTSFDADVLVLSKRLDFEVVVDCVQEASCSVLLV